MPEVLAEFMPGSLSAILPEIVLLLLLGLLASTFGSLVGLGGGIIIVPVLLLFGAELTGAPIDHPTAVGTSLLVLVITALSSTLTYTRARLIDFRSGWLLFVTSGPAAMLGSFWTGQLNGQAFALSFGLFLLGMAVLLVVKERLKPIYIKWPVRKIFTAPDGITHEYGYGVTLFLVIGLFVGLLSGLFGIGGGSLFVPLMVLLFRFPPHLATATSMFVILLSAALGSIVHASVGNINYSIALTLAPAAWIGGKLGANLARRLSGGLLLLVLRITLFVFALRFILDGLGLSFG